MMSKRAFAASLYNYRAASNPRVFLSLSRDGAPLGDLVFEVYANQAPRTASNFLDFVNSGAYKGTAFTAGFPGIVLRGGHIEADAERLAD